MSVKRYTDLSNEELASLTEEQVQHYIDVEIAIAGIIPCEKPVFENEPEISIKPTVTAFQCQGIVFKKEEDVIAFSKLETFSEGYNNKAGYSYKYLEEKTSYAKNIETCSYYSKDDIASIAAQLEEKRLIKSRNESKEKEWDKYRESISDIISGVYNAINDAKNEVEEIAKAKKNFQKYLSLASGDREIAEKFLRDAYKDYGEGWIAVILAD